jgi:hypothetical protein
VNETGPPVPPSLHLTAWDRDYATRVIATLALASEAALSREDGPGVVVTGPDGEVVMAITRELAVSLLETWRLLGASFAPARGEPRLADAGKRHPDAPAAPPELVMPSGCRTFAGWRPSPPPEYAEKGITNSGASPDYWGVIFPDGTVAVRWATAWQSHSAWAAWGDFERVHGHPEYGTRIKFDDGGGPPGEAP